MFMWVTFILLLGMVLFCLVVTIFDHRKKRPSGSDRPLSFLIPCYNDGSTIRATIESIVRSCRAPEFEILIADDGSTDDSAAVVKTCAQMYPVRFFRNAKNLGKAETLNQLAGHARFETIVFVDADTLLNERSLADMTSRLAANDRLGAVSCPYQPANKGWLPGLQSVDYSMIMLVQGGYNVFSGLALWGGCIAVRRAAFEQAGRFSLSAITEDVDLAHKLNREGWVVQQSMVSVRSHVPETLRGWIRQKTRWTAGGFQCLYTHPSVWMKNPLQLVLIAIYSFLSISCAVAVVKSILMLTGMVDIIQILVDQFILSETLQILTTLYLPDLLRQLTLSLAFGLLNGIYIVPLITQWQDISKFFLVFPFMLAYFPVYIIVSMLGLGYFLLHSRRLAMEEARAW